MNTKINWDELYSDLSGRAAKALRDARIQPAQLIEMSDGELTALPGIGEVALEEIRTKYSTTLTEQEVEEKTLKREEEPEVKKPKKVSRDQYPPNKRHLHRASKIFKKKSSQIEKERLYTLEEALDLLPKVNNTKFNSTITLHLNLKDRLSKVEVTFPHTTGKTKTIAIADEALLTKIEKGELDFDILITTPAMMPKLAKFARVLGPKGLMPSPKTGTITPDPESKKKELEGGKTLIKCENKFPLMHVTVGKIEQKPEELAANIAAVINAVKPRNIVKATLASSMSTGIKLYIER